jgi:hypothetical protein
LSRESRSKAIATAVIGQYTKLDIAHSIAINVQEIKKANNVQEKNNKSGDTRNTTDLSIPRDTQPSPSSACAPSTVRQDTPEPAAPAEAAAVLPPQLGRPRTATTATATVTTTATVTPPLPLFTCRYCPKQLLTARGMRQHEVTFCKVNPGSTAALRATLPLNTGISQSTDVAAGAGACADTEVGPNARFVSSTSTMNLASTSAARQPLPALVLNATSSLPLPSASSLPSNSNASRAAPMPARLPGRVEASPLRAGEYTQRQLDTRARSRKSQSQSQSQQSAISDVEDDPPPQDIAVDDPTTSHRQLQPQSQRGPHRRRNIRPDLVPDPHLTARPNLGQRQRSTSNAGNCLRQLPTPLPLSPAQPQPGCVPIYATFTTRAGQIFALSALNARLNPTSAALQAEEEGRIRRDNDLSLPGRLVEMGRMHEAERQRVREQQLAPYEAERLWVEGVGAERGLRRRS